MLDFIRKKKESVVIKIVFALIVFSFIGAFAFSYIEGGSKNSGYAAKVDGHRISLEEYRSSYERLRNFYMQIYGQSLPAEMEKALGLKKTALDQLIDNTLVAREAKRMGIKISKEEVANEIAAAPMFQKDGAFNFELYQQLLKSNRITAKEFEEGQKNDMAIRKARQSIRDKASVSDDEALAQYRKENDKVELEYVSYAPADVLGEIEPTESDLNDYLQKNQNDFKIPEKIAISHILIDPTQQFPKLAVTDEEVNTYYSKNIDRWQGKDGIMPLEKIRDRVRTETLKQKAAKQAYELAADTLFKNIKSGDLKLIAAKLNMKIQDSPFFTASAAPQSLAGETAVIKKAFELKQGELGGPVETSKGIYIIKVRERKEASVPPMKDIRAEVEQRAKAVKAVELAKAKADQAAREMKDKSMAKAHSTGVFGYSAKGDIPQIGSSPALMEEIFKLTSAAPAAAAPVKVGNRWYAVRLKHRTEAPKTDFEKNKDQLKARMLPKKQEEAVTSWIKGLRDKAKIEINTALITDK